MALRRQVKNVVKNFSDIEVKVRECTSNDPWGPSSSLMSEIADATYNVQAFSQIMIMLWKRINDHGKNWRHVYKSLVVLDYIVKTGSERVAQQCRENIFAIKTLKDFQFIDKDGKDQGINVREKSKQLVALLKDDERLKGERQRALKAKERFTQSQGGIGNTSYPKNKRFANSSKYPEAKGSVDDFHVPSRSWHESERAEDSRSTDGRIDSEMEKVRPSNETEEELQLQVALAMSREEAERETAKDASQESHQIGSGGTLLHLTDPVSLESTSTIDPWSQHPPTPPIQTTTTDPWSNQPSIQSLPPATDPWGAPSKPVVDPWSPPQTDPWNVPPPPVVLPDPFPLIPSTQVPPLNVNHSSNPIMFNVNQPMERSSQIEASGSLTNNSPKPSFLSNGAHLVDVENILAPTTSSDVRNPFMASAPLTSTNPFMQDKPKPKSMNELRNTKTSFGSIAPSGDVLLPTPMPPTAQQNNPFLL